MIYSLVRKLCTEQNDYTQIVFADISTKKVNSQIGYATERKIYSKKPIVHYLPGAVFESDNPGKIKGKALDNIHFMEEIIQFMIPFTVEVKL